MGGIRSQTLSYTDSVMGAWSFSYDQLNRLVTAANGGALLAGTLAVPAPGWAANFCWAYDAFGNRLQQGNSDQPFAAGENGACNTTGSLASPFNIWASYDAQNHVTQTNAPGWTDAPSYDAAGDVTADGANQYVYDAEGRLCAVQSMDPLTGTFDGNWTGYLYDAAGNRVAKGSLSSNVTASNACDITTNGFVQTAGYVVGPSGEQLTEVDASNNWKHTNVYAGGKQIGTYDGNVSAPTLHFYFDDPLGTRRAQTNSSGVLEATYQSLPFGDGLAQNPVTTTDDPTENHFTGKERDTESGNDYFLARYYNSATGRFLSPDWSAMLEPVPYAKLGDPQTLNLYAYMENNPIRGIDPDGHDGCYADDMPTDCSLLTSENSVADESDTEKFADALIGYNERDQLAKDKAKERVGKTTVGSLARTMTNEDGSLSGGAPGELEKGKTALANAIINNAGLAVPAPVAPDTGTASDQDTEIMDDAYTNRVNGGADPVQGRSQYGTTQNPNVKYRDANNKMHGVAGQETVYAKFGPFTNSISPRPTWIVIYNDPGH